MPVVRHRLLVSSSSIAALLLWVNAAADPADDNAPDQIVVTATRIEQPLSRIGDAITVLNADQIRLQQKTAVSDLLTGTPGVTASRNGGLGTATSVRIRGAESDQTIVLIDGVKLNDPSTPGGGFNFGNLIAADYSRIEVLRGPQSTLWGSQAIGGVVNIVTSVPQGPLSGAISTEAGEHGTAAVTARLESGNERYSWRVRGNYLTTDGISAFDEDLGGGERDGYRNVGFNARGIYNFNEAVTAELRTTFSRGRVEFDGFPPPVFAFADTRDFGITEELVAYGGLNLSTFEGRLEHRLGFAYTDTDRENFDPGSQVRQTFDARGRNERWEYQATLDIDERASLVLGLESERSELSTASPSEFDPNPLPLASDIRLDSIFAQVQFAPFTGLNFTAGLRYDDHDTFGSNTTLRSAAAWSLTPTTVLRASYGEGFKAPTLFQLFSEFGNEALQAERAHGWDAGVEQTLFTNRLTANLTFFERDSLDNIDFISCFDGTDMRCATRPGGFFDNVQRTRAHGVEVALVARLTSALDVTLNYTGMQSENDVRSSADFGRELPRRARESSNLQINYRWPVELTTALAVQKVGRSFDNASNSAVLAGYTLVDVRAAYQLSDAWEIYGRIENLLDENYQTVRRFGALDRATYLGARRRF